MDSLCVREKEGGGCRVPSEPMLGLGLEVAWRSFPCGGVSRGVVTGASEVAKIASRLRAAAFTDVSRSFFTRADRYNSKARSDRRTGEDGSYSQHSELLCMVEFSQT